MGTEAGDARGPLAGGIARGPIPDGLADTGSCRGNSCAWLPKIRFAQPAPAKRGSWWGWRGVGGATSSFVRINCISLFGSAFPVSPGGAVEGGELLRLSPISHASDCLCGERRARALARALTHSRTHRSVSRMFGSTRSHSLAWPFGPHSCNV